MLAMCWSAASRAQEATGASNPTPAATEQPNTAAAPSAAPATDAAQPVTSESLLQVVEQQGRALAEAQAKLEELAVAAEVAAASAPAATDSHDDDILKIYGFMDVGVQRLWLKEDSPLASFFNSANATSFVVGNLNTYFDMQPIPGWRGLLEIRFTNAPHGEIANLGGLAGTFERTTTQQIDPHSSTVNAPMWGGYVAIERAHIDWTDNELLKVRAGNFFTPFGIWNVDHGTPTLISLTLPQTVVFLEYPIRQTGLMLYGSKIVGEWELGYHATLSNGRQELSNFAFDDNRGLGARLYASREDGAFTVKVGLSGYTGRTRDNSVDLTDFVTGTIRSHPTFDYREWVGGADLSLDIGPTRIRTEALIRSVRYKPGLHGASPFGGAPGATAPNRNEATGYFLIAHQLPFLGLEPFAIVDSFYAPISGFDVVLIPAVGLNVRFNKSVQWKNQLNYHITLDTKNGSDQSDFNLWAAYSRLVLVY